MSSEQLMTIEKVFFMAALVLYLLSTAMYFVNAVSGRKKIEKLAYALIIAAFVVHTATIAVRGINAGRLPLTNRYEFASAFAWGIALCYIVLAKRLKFEFIGVFIAPIIFLVIGYAAMQSREINALMPALQSNWLGFHVSTAVIAYGSFAVSFGVALAYLFGRAVKREDGSRLPDDARLDVFCYRAVSLGFLFLTLCIVTGAIWAKRAWGSYWNWDPKETWSLVTWIIYAVFLHLRLSKGLAGKKAAWFVLIGFVCVIFTYIGVNLLGGLHSYV